MFVVIAGVAVYAGNTSFLKDALNKSNVWDARRCGCIRCKCIIFEDALNTINVFDDCRNASMNIMVVLPSLPFPRPRRWPLVGRRIHKPLAVAAEPPDHIAGPRHMNRPVWLYTQ